MKVLHLLKTSQGAMWAYRQIEILKKKGVEVVAVLPDCHGRLYTLLKELEIEVIELDLNINKAKPYKAVKHIMAIRKLVEKVKPDLIHSHFVVTTYLMRIALRDFDIPRVFQVPGPLHLEKEPYGSLEIKLSDQNDYWIATCKWTRDKYLKLGIPSERVFLSYYGTDISSFEQSNRGKLRKELGIPSNDPIIGMIAFMYPPKRYLGYNVGIKGHEDFIEAFSHVKKAMPKARGIIVGGQWGKGDQYERKLKRYAQENCGDSMTFLGFRNDVPHIYPDFDVAVHPSLTENLGGAVESMLSRVPTITTNIGGFPDIVIDRDTGLLTEPRNPVMLSEKIIEAIQNKDVSLHMARKGKRLVESLLDVQKTGSEVAEIYGCVMAKSLKGRIS